MNYKEFNISLPINTNNVGIVDGIVQYDTANIVNARLLDGLEPFDFTGYTNVFIEVLKPDGTHVQTCVCEDPEVTDDNNPYAIQIVDPAEGRISFTLQGQMTILTGTHFCQIMITVDGRILTTARMNYYVGDTLQKDYDSEDLTSSDEYTSLRTLITQNSLIATAERDRVDAETLRKLAEIAREERMDELADEITEYLDNADSYVTQTKEYMELAQQYAQFAQDPSLEIIETLIESLNLAPKDYVDNSITTATKDFEAGNFTDTNRKILSVIVGNEADLPELETGEMGFAKDTEVLYMGGENGNLPLNGVFIAQSTAPERKDLLWIDTGSGNSIKFWNGSEWAATATATFA